VKTDRSLIIILSIALLIAVSAFAQQTSPQQNSITASQAPLTNKDVLAMQNSGLGTEIIVAKIKSSSCDFDTSPAALEQLRVAKIPSEVILAMVKAPVANGSPQAAKPTAQATNTARHPSSYVGAYVVNATPAAHRVLVKYVTPDGPAANAGIRDGDIVEAVNGQAVISVADYQEKFSQLDPPTQVTFTIFRKGRESTLTVTALPLRATVTFVTVENGQVVHLMPNWAIDWIKKNLKKYPGVKFQTSGPASGEQNYVIAFSYSSNAVNGFEPVTHTDTSTSTDPVSANGTVTNDQGDSWNYTMNGEVTTTTTTTTTTNEAYTRTYNALYLTAYNEQGQPVAQRWHVYSSQQGGNPYKSAAYNLGSALAAIHAKGDLMQAILKDVGLAKQKKAKEKMGN
jgi:hypothetical protein